MAYARLVRGEVLSIRERDFVKAARSIGVSNGKIIVRHILPNVLSSFIVVSALTVATTIIVEASLSFLGLGIQPPTISWGVMLSDGRDYLATNWWIATFPGLAITITVLGIIFIGDWLRDLPVSYTHLDVYKRQRFSLRHRFINRQSGNLRRCLCCKSQYARCCIDQHNQSQSNENTDAELWSHGFPDSD